MRPRSSRRGASVVGVALVAVAVAGCAKPGTQAPFKQAAQLDVATERISVACGYAQELTAFGGKHPPGLKWIESVAESGARKLASVYDTDQTGIYQGESVGAIVNDSITLLSDCGLPNARKVLRQALQKH